MEGQPSMKLLVSCESALEVLDLSELDVTLFSNIITKARSCPMRTSTGVSESKFISLYSQLLEVSQLSLTRIGEK